MLIIVMRLRSNLCLWGEPPKYSGRGKPRVHGDKFKLNDSTTWSEAAQTIEEKDSQVGYVKIRVWHNLHFREVCRGEAPHGELHVNLPFIP